MPRRFERHRRTKWEWGLPGSRSGEVRSAASADPDPARKAPSKKDTKHWCKGKPGIEHIAQLTLDMDTPEWRKHACRWKAYWDWRKKHTWVIGWTCGHHEECARCGKILRYTCDLTRAECPVYPGTGAQRAEADAELAALLARPSPGRWRREPVITGPQGYRKPKRLTR